MDYHRDFSNTVAARLFWLEHKSKISSYRRLDSLTDRYRRHTHHTVPAWGGVNHSQFDDLTGSVEADEIFISLNRKAICHPFD